MLAPILAAPPWFAEVESRRSFLACALRQLLTTPGSPLQRHPAICQAYLITEAVGATKAEDLAGPQLGPAGSQQDGCEAAITQGGSTDGVGKGVYAAQRVQLSAVDRARAAAREVLASQRDNLALWGALALVEALVGNNKVGGGKVMG